MEEELPTCKGLLLWANSQEIRGWAKDGKHGRRGHYRTTFRWFAKFVETLGFA